MALIDAWRALRTIDTLMQLEAKQGVGLERLQLSLARVEDRVTRLEARQDLVAVEALSSARAGAADAMQGVILQNAERLGALEARVGQPGLMVRRTGQGET